jgi:hypothetical protein|tara:strand:- start:56 stop:907 length:852 start_codon:yes stop_codon:yes gene_type:complete
MNLIKSTKYHLEYAFLKSTRIFPSIFIAGFQKCGSSSIYYYLSQAESLVQGKVKEKNNLSHEKLDLVDYLKNFPLKHNGGKTFCGSHQLTYFPEGLERLKELVPDAKIVLIMRNPIDRAYSMYQHNCRYSDDGKKSFREWVDIELDILSSIKDIEDTKEIFEKTKWRNRPEGSWDMTFKLSTGMNISRGIYYNYIKIIKELGLDFHPIILENLKKGFHTEMTMLFDFLELDTNKVNKIKIESQNIGGYKTQMDDKTRDILCKFYKPHNDKLFELLQQKNPWIS